MYKQSEQPYQLEEQYQIQQQKYQQKLLQNTQNTQKQKQQNQQQQAEQQSSDNGANDYGSVQYWQQRYIKTEGQRFDWLQNYDTLRQMIIKLVNGDKNVRILNVGCGNGSIQDYLYQSGFKNIYNNDISTQVIKQMNKIKKQKNQQNMIYQVMDVTAMTYPNSYFQLVLDKSTIDALLCSENPFVNTALMLQQIDRVLVDDGVYLAVSYSAPENRMRHLKRKHVSFDVDIQELRRINERGDQLVHYAYICRKGSKNVQKSSTYNNNNQKKQENQTQGQINTQNLTKNQVRDKNWRDKFYQQLKKQQDSYYND